MAPQDLLQRPFSGYPVPSPLTVLPHDPLRTDEIKGMSKRKAEQEPDLPRYASFLGCHSSRAPKPSSRISSGGSAAQLESWELAEFVSAILTFKTWFSLLSRSTSADAS